MSHAHEFAMCWNGSLFNECHFYLILVLAMQCSICVQFTLLDIDQWNFFKRDSVTHILKHVIKRRISSVTCSAFLLQGDVKSNANNFYQRILIKDFLDLLLMQKVHEVIVKFSCQIHNDYNTLICMFKHLKKIQWLAIIKFLTAHYFENV